MVGPGDVLTFAQSRDIRVIRITGMPARRGPAPEAQGLYDDLDPPKPRDTVDNRKVIAPTPRYEGKGRPTKRVRRQGDLSRRRNLE